MSKRWWKDNWEKRVKQRQEAEEALREMTPHQVQMVARLCEESYRRGAQQGAFFAEVAESPRDQSWYHDWRYQIPLDDSPRLDFDGVGAVSKSLERLMVEHGR